MDKLTNVWRHIPHHLKELRNESIDWCLENDRVTMGWGGVGDLSVSNYSTSQAIGKAIRTECGLTNGRIGGPSLWRFYHDVKPGDYIILSGTRYRRPVVQVTEQKGGQYIFQPNGFLLDDNYKHHLITKATDIDYQGLIGGRSWKSEAKNSIRSPFIRVVLPNRT